MAFLKFWQRSKQIAQAPIIEALPVSVPEVVYLPSYRSHVVLPPSYGTSNITSVPEVVYLPTNPGAGIQHYGGQLGSVIYQGAPSISNTNAPKG